jgi:hypothetical protein
MQFDLQKELGLHNTPAAAKPAIPWLYIIAGVSAVNLVVIIGIFMYILAGGKSDDDTIPVSKIVEVTSQMFAYTEVRLSQLENAVNNINSSLKESQKDLTLVEAEQRITKKRERRKIRAMQKSGMSDKDIKDAIANLQTPPPQATPLNAEETARFDALIDEDDSGDQVRALINSQTDPGKRLSYVQVIRRKGDQWYDAAINAIRSNDPDSQMFVENTMYFYNILSDTSRDNATIALIQAKINQLKLTQQNADIQAKTEELSEQQKQQLADLKEELKPKETASEAEQRRIQRRRAVGPIQNYDAAGIRKSYEGDWDPDPRVRERRGQGETVRKSDLNYDWDPDPRTREEMGIKD